MGDTKVRFFQYLRSRSSKSWCRGVQYLGTNRVCGAQGTCRTHRGRGSAQTPSLPARARPRSPRMSCSDCQAVRWMDGGGAALPGTVPRGPVSPALGAQGPQVRPHARAAGAGGGTWVLTVLVLLPPCRHRQAPWWPGTAHEGTDNACPPRTLV